MNILIFSWRDPKHPLAGGAEQVMHEHMKGWVGNGHEVTLFSSRFNSSKKEEVLDGIRIIRSGYQYLGVQLSGFFYYLKNKNSYDFVVDQFHGLPFFTPIYVKKPKLAVIQETARKVWFLNPLPWPINWVTGMLGYLVEPWVFKLYRNVPFMTGSQSAKKDVVKMGIPASNINVVPHGVIIKKSKIKYQKSKIKTVVYLGILSRDKGIEDAIRCFSILNKLGECNFWVIGKPETQNYFNQLKRLTKKLGIAEKVKFWGLVTQEKKFELLSRAHVLINPSAHEGWGLVNIEANAMGVPVVAYNVSGIIDSVKDGASGILCQENTPEDMARRIKDLIRDEVEYAKLHKGALSWSKNFSWEKSRRLSLFLINKIANEK